VSALTTLFVDVSKQDKTMQTHLRKAKTLRDRLNRYRMSPDLMDDLTVHEIEKTLASTKNSNPYLEDKLSKYKELKQKIEQQEYDPAFLTEASYKTMQLKVEKAKQVLQTIQTADNIRSEKGFNAHMNVKQGTTSELECVICMELPIKHVFSCTEQHIVCSKCNLKIDKCPICRQDFKATPTSRNRLAEKIILRLK
jgi:hypothetical protein